MVFLCSTLIAPALLIPKVTLESQIGPSSPKLRLIENVYFTKHRNIYFAKFITILHGGVRPIYYNITILYYVIYEQPLMIKRNMITTSITVVIIIIIIHLMMKRGVFRTEIFDRGQESGENL